MFMFGVTLNNICQIVTHNGSFEFSLTNSFIFLFHTTLVLYIFCFDDCRLDVNSSLLKHTYAYVRCVLMTDLNLGLQSGVLLH